jgi:hypothetical protein
MLEQPPDMIGNGISSDPHPFGWKVETALEAGSSVTEVGEDGTGSHYTDVQVCTGQLTIQSSGEIIQEGFGGAI